MPSSYNVNSEGRITNIMTVVNIYQYQNFFFEHSSFLGPLKLKKDLTPAAVTGRKFYKVFEKWSQLPVEEKAKTLIFGFTATK